MTPDEIAASLPNGFHDAELKSLAIDYVKREARLILDMWIGEMQPEEERETYRLAEFTLSDLLFWVTEPPHPDYPFKEAGAQRIDMGALETLPQRDAVKLPPLPQEYFGNWIFVVSWNAFIYFAAKNSELKWLGVPTIRHNDID
jgi:hypothetical protein